MTVQANASQVSDLVDNDGVVDNANDDKSSQGVDEKTQETVSYQQHKRLLAQRKADQLKAKELEARLAEYEQQETERQESMLKEQQKYKELAELKEQKLKEFEAKEKEREKALLDGAKLNAFKEKLPGQVDNPQYYAFVNLDAIEVDADTGIVDADSVEKQVNEFVTKHRGLFTPRSGKKLPGEAPDVHSPMSYVDELRACKSQRDFERVQKKWGKV